MGDETGQEGTGPHVVFDRVTMAFGGREVFRDLSFELPRRKISVLLGGSGSGKTTALRLIGGLVRPVSGRILVDGEDVTRISERGLYRARRKLGMMFQGGALLDAMTVEGNLALPLLERGGVDRAAIAAEVADRLEAVGLPDAGDLLPGELSGGMTKRIALARAIIQRPEILLCDEPFSGLDPISTRRIESLLVDINGRYGMTTIVVSHHVPSTLRMADRVLLLLPEGKVEGTPEELRRSSNPRVTSFLDESAEAPVPGEVERAPGGLH